MRAADSRCLRKKGREVRIDRVGTTRPQQRDKQSKQQWHLPEHGEAIAEARHWQICANVSGQGKKKSRGGQQCQGAYYRERRAPSEPMPDQGAKRNA